MWSLANLRAACFDYGSYSRLANIEQTKLACRKLITTKCDQSILDQTLREPISDDTKDFSHRKGKFSFLHLFSSFCWLL